MGFFTFETLNKTTILMPTENITPITPYRILIVESVMLIHEHGISDSNKQVITASSIRVII